MAGGLQEARCFGKEVACVILREDLDRFGNGLDLVLPRLAPLGVGRVGGGAPLLQVHEELLVCAERAARVVRVRLRLRHLCVRVRQLGTLLLGRLAAGLQLALLGRPELLEGDLCLHLRALSRGQVLLEGLLHLLQHAEDRGAPCAVRSCPRRRTRRLLLQAGDDAPAVGAVARWDGAEEVPQVLLHHRPVNAATGRLQHRRCPRSLRHEFPDLEQCGGCRLLPTASPLQKLNLRQHRHSLPQGPNGLGQVLRLFLILPLLFLTQCCSLVQGVLVRLDVVLEA
mmetsp:Transcript_105645/g.308964  ORF Transcript_105645/g.308964 Transcript_105645/m.308964 type:complete len:283 (+) Transcript_105645:699-1547(+)